MGNATQDWTFSQKHNAWELTSGGPPVRVANVVVQTVPYKTIGINKRAGISAQVAQVLGRGHAEVLSGSAAGGSGGTAASGTWAKTHIRDVTNYLENSGSPHTTKSQCCFGNTRCAACTNSNCPFSGAIRPITPIRHASLSARFRRGHATGATPL